MFTNCFKHPVKQESKQKNEKLFVELHLKIDNLMTQQEVIKYFVQVNF